MIFEIDKSLVLSNQDSKREKRIIKRLNITRLPFKITEENFCSSYLEMIKDIRPLFKYKSGEYAMKWCFSTDKRMKVFLLIFEANEQGREIYKENISSKLPEYSYKTIAQIIDQGIAKGFFVKLAPRKCNMKDSKIRNIRPSEDLVVEFMNWNIDLISIITGFKKKYSELGST